MLLAAAAAASFVCHFASSARWAAQAKVPAPAAAAAAALLLLCLGGSACQGDNKQATRGAGKVETQQILAFVLLQKLLHGVYTARVCTGTTASTVRSHGLLHAKFAGRARLAPERIPCLPDDSPNCPAAYEAAATSDSAGAAAGSCMRQQLHGQQALQRTMHSHWHCCMACR
jgi:hypothetical protein